MYERAVNGEEKTRYYYYNGQVIAEGTIQPDDTTTLKTRYIRGHGLISQMDSNGDKLYYLLNGHGDVVEMRNSSGNLVNQYYYDLWGKPTVRLGTATSFMYSGEYWDHSTNLQYLRARWYDPSQGRFINEDTYEGEISNPLSLNLYTYVPVIMCFYKVNFNPWESPTNRLERPPSNTKAKVVSL
jgi:RHS repeat-associated protein